MGGAALGIVGHTTSLPTGTGARQGAKGDVHLSSTTGKAPIHRRSRPRPGQARRRGRVSSQPATSEPTAERAFQKPENHDYDRDDDDRDDDQIDDPGHIGIDANASERQYPGEQDTKHA